ncbi:MAG TPA: hypothetical protein VE914_18545 [Candidatus Angelobacter sp.]|nr:hypothetical protein [Candidatus Angelobacter sp.]
MALTELEDDFTAMRSALELTLAEQIVVWSLRRYKAAEARLEALAATYRLVFGLAGVERALASFGRLIAVIERHSRRRGAPAGLDRLHLSPTESCVLRLVMAAQRGDDGTADAVAAWLVTRAGHAALVESARDFSACLAVAGQQLAGDDTPGLFAVTGLTRGPDEPVLPSVTRAADLTPDETLLLQAIRIWVSCARESRCGGPALMEHLAAHGTANAGASLHAILYNSSVAATRPIDVRCRRCPNLSPDEARLLHAVACGQHGLPARAAGLLADWLPAAAVRLTIDAVIAAGRELGASGVALPWRAWDFAALERLSAPPPTFADARSDEPAKRVLH